MEENKIYKITVLNIITCLYNLVIIIPVCIFCLISTINKMDNGLFYREIILFSFFTYLLSYYGIYPILLCWSYYQREKNVTIFIDYEKKELQYIEKEKDIQYIKFKNIVTIERYIVVGIGIGYDKIILNNSNSIVITSLLIGNKNKAIHKAIPNMRTEIKKKRNLFLPHS